MEGFRTCTLTSATATTNSAWETLQKTKRRPLRKRALPRRFVFSLPATAANSVSNAASAWIPKRLRCARRFRPAKDSSRCLNTGSEQKTAAPNRAASLFDLTRREPGGGLNGRKRPDTVSEPGPDPCPSPMLCRTPCRQPNRITFFLLIKPKNGIAFPRFAYK